MVFLGYINLLTIKSSILYKDIVKCSDFKDKIFEFFLHLRRRKWGTDVVDLFWIWFVFYENTLVLL